MFISGFSILFHWSAYLALGTFWLLFLGCKFWNWQMWFLKLCCSVSTFFWLLWVPTHFHKNFRYLWSVSAKKHQLEFLWGSNSLFKSSKSSSSWTTGCLYSNLNLFFSKKFSDFQCTNLTLHLLSLFLDISFFLGLLK